MLNTRSFMQSILFMIVVGTTLLPYSISARAGGDEQVAVIVNKDNPVTPSVSELKGIFLGERTLWQDNEESIRLFLQSKKRPSSIIFHHYFFHDRGRKMSRRWVQNIFTGAAPPPVTLENDQAVLKKVAGNKTAIGYVRMDLLTDTPQAGKVRVILLFNGEETIPHKRSSFQDIDVDRVEP